MKNTLYIFIILFTFSCKSSKVTTSEVREKVVIKDSIIYKNKIIYKPGIRDTLLIESPCDSLGNIKPIYSKLKSNKGEVTLKTVKGNLRVDINIKDSVDSTNTTYTNTKENIKFSDLKSEKIIKIVWSKWTYIFLIIALLELYIIIMGGPRKALTSIIKIFI